MKMVKEQESLTHKANQRNKAEEFFRITEVKPGKTILSAAEKLIKKTKAALEWNPVTGTPMTIQGELSDSLEGKPFAAARQFLVGSYDVFGIKKSFEDFIERDLISWGGFTHTRFQQIIEGISVFGSEVLVSLDPANAVRAFFGSFNREIEIYPEEKPISKRKAIDAGIQDLGEDVELRAAVTSDMVWYPTKEGHRKAYHLVIPALSPLGDWEYFIDIETGKILDSYNMMCFYYAGRGEVYRENPNDPLTTEILRNLRHPRRKLVGKYCRVLNEDGPEAVASSQSFYDRRFFYSPNNTHFDEVQMYYSVEAVYEYFRSLGFRGFLTKGRGGIITSNVHVRENYDNAYYSPITGQLYFGDGSGPPMGLNDFSKEFDVVAHEFTHALIDEYRSIYGTEGRALHEGYADYFACSITNDPILGEYVVPGAGNFIRTVNNTNTYPGPSTQPHQMGQIWGGACWELRQALGQDVSDYLVFGSILLLPIVPSFKEAKDRILFIDRWFMGGQYEGVIRNIFEANRGIPV